MAFVELLLKVGTTRNSAVESSPSIRKCWRQQWHCAAVAAAQAIPPMVPGRTEVRDDQCRCGATAGRRSRPRPAVVAVRSIEVAGFTHRIGCCRGAQGDVGYR
jgi:hypothetical protein